MQPRASYLAITRSYRVDGRELDPDDGPAQRHLRDAADALHMAMLALEGPGDEAEGGKLRRAAHSRRLLVEAVTAFSRARLYIAGVRTYAVPVVMAGEPDQDAELARIHQLCTRLSWYNHEYLPAKPQAEPLTGEDEAQLARLFKNLELQARIDRAIRHKWLLAVGVSGALVPLLGAPMAIVAAACAAVAVIGAVRREPATSGYSG